MSQSIEMSGKTVDEAVRRALAELQLSADAVSVEVLEEESGFLGIGKNAKVRVTVLPEVAESYSEATAESPVITAEEAPEAADEVEETENAADNEQTAETAEYTEADNSEETPVEELDEEAKVEVAVSEIAAFLESVLESFSLSGVNTVNVSVESGRILAEIDGADCGILIGRKGETLNAMQYLCSLIANKTSRSRMRVSLDIGGYKAKRENSVASLAVRTAERAVRTGQAYELTPMTAAERRVVHETLQDFAGVTTYSEGDEPNRYVVIDLAFEDEMTSDDNKQS